ncbi:MAG: PKD domain-containing protein, partial [Phaeodactylibacter sp.]|nr:PKD domain-containing protein [Phaeodactylibacter sp.]
MISAERFLNHHHFCILFCLLLASGAVFAQGGDYGIPDYRGVRLLSGMLHFKTQTDFDAVYEDLTNRQYEWYEQVESLPSDPVPGTPCPDPDPLLEAFEQKLGLQSVRKKFVQIECELLEAGEAPEAIPDHYLVDDVLAALMNEQYQLRIGNDLYYLPAPRLQFKVKNADYAALDALVNGANPYQLRNVEVLEGGQGCNASFTVNADENSTTVGFAFTGTPQTGDVSYLWEFGDGQSAFDENPTHQYSSNGSYT